MTLLQIGENEKYIKFNVFWYYFKSIGKNGQHFLCMQVKGEYFDFIHTLYLDVSNDFHLPTLQEQKHKTNIDFHNDNCNKLSELFLPAMLDLFEQSETIEEYIKKVNRQQKSK